MLPVGRVARSIRLVVRPAAVYREFTWELVSGWPK